MPQDLVAAARQAFGGGCGASRADRRTPSGRPGRKGGDSLVALTEATDWADASNGSGRHGQSPARSGPSYRVLAANRVACDRSHGVRAARLSRRILPDGRSGPAWIQAPRGCRLPDGGIVETTVKHGCQGKPVQRVRAEGSPYHPGEVSVAHVGRKGCRPSSGTVLIRLPTVRFSGVLSS